MLSLGWVGVVFQAHACCRTLKPAVSASVLHQVSPCGSKRDRRPLSLDLRGLPRRGLLGDPLTQVPGCTGARGRGPSLGSLGVAARPRQGLHHLKAQLGWAPRYQIVHLQGCEVTCAGLHAARRSRLTQLPQPACSWLRMASSNLLFPLLRL